MPSQSPDPPNDFVLRQRALARWESEGGKTLPLDSPRVESAEQTQIPEMTNAEIVALRVRVIALENVLISLLATAPDHQLKLIREMADYISPRPGFTPHPLTIHAAEHMVDLVDRSTRFRSHAEVVWPNQQETSQNGRFESP
jgi:hypothetical protein